MWIVCGLSVDGIIDSLFPCQLFVQDIHLEQNYDLVSNKIHFQIDLFFQIVPFCPDRLGPGPLIPVQRTYPEHNSIRFLFYCIPFVRVKIVAFKFVGIFENKFSWTISTICSRLNAIWCLNLSSKIQVLVRPSLE